MRESSHLWGVIRFSRVKICAEFFLTIINALPNINTATSGIPYTALAVEGPMHVHLPDSCGVSDNYARHFWGWMGVIGSRCGKKDRCVEKVNCREIMVERGPFIVSDIAR